MSGWTLASEPAFTLHARECDAKDCHGGKGVACAYCFQFYRAGMVCGACRDCRDRWAEFPGTLPPTWVARVRDHLCTEVDTTRAGYFYTPLYVCEPCASGGGGRNGAVSMHEHSIASHVNNWHGPTIKACLRMLSAEEHAARGWDVALYPEYIRA